MNPNGYNQYTDEAPNYRDEKWLHQKYWVEGLTQRDIGDLCDVTQACIKKWMKKCDIPTKDDAGQFETGENHRNFNPDRFVETPCSNCGNTLTRREDKLGEEAFCNSECMGEWRVGENNPHFNPDKESIPNGTRWSSIADEIRERDNHTCQKCGYCSDGGYSLDVHHIIPRRLFHKWASVDDGNVPRNLITLCKGCHRNIEFGNMTQVYPESNINRGGGQ